MRSAIRSFGRRNHGSSSAAFLGTPMGSPTFNYGGAESGAEQGAATGAAIGTDVPIPGIGTVSGAAIGSVIGAIVGGIGFGGGSANVQFEQCCLPDQKACIYYSAYDDDPNLCNTCPGWDATWTATTLGTDQAIPSCLRDILLPGLTTLTLPSLAVLLAQRYPDYPNSHVPYQAIDAANAAINAMPYPAWPEWAEPSNFVAGNVQSAITSYWLDAYEQLIALGIATGVRSPNEVAAGGSYKYLYPLAVGTRMPDQSIDETVGPNSPPIVSTYNVPKTVGPLLTQDQFSAAQASIASALQGAGGSIYDVNAMAKLANLLSASSSGPSQDPVAKPAAPTDPSKSDAKKSHVGTILAVTAVGALAATAAYRVYHHQPIVPAKVKDTWTKAKRAVTSRL